MDVPDSASLLRLNDTPLDLAEGSQDIRKRRVLDTRGEEVGEILDLIIDDTEKRVRFMLVASGGFLGIGEKRMLIPIDAIRAIDDKNVHITRSREHVAGAPAYDPDVVDKKHLEDVTNYWGAGAYWLAGYMYPTFRNYL